MAGKITINGVDLKTTYGIGTVDAQGWWDGAIIQAPHTLPYKAYHSRRGVAFNAPPRPWPLRLFLRESTFANRETDLDSLRRTLNKTPDYQELHRYANEGEVGIELAGLSGRMLYAVYQGDRITPPAALAWETGHAGIELDLMIHDQAKYSDESTVSSITTTYKDVALGTLPSWWELTIAGAATDPEIIIADSSSVELWRLSLDFNLGAGDDLIVSGLLHTVMEDDGTPADVTDEALPLDASNAEFKMLEPDEDDTGVKIKVTSGTGSLKYRKRWR